MADGKFIAGAPGAEPATYEITVEMDGREKTFGLSIADAMKLIVSIQTEVLDHWRGTWSEGTIAVIHAEGVRLGTTPSQAAAIRVDSSEIGPFLLELGPRGLSELLRISAERARQLQ